MNCAYCGRDVVPDRNNSCPNCAAPIQKVRVWEDITVLPSRLITHEIVSDKWLRCPEGSMGLIKEEMPIVKPSAKSNFDWWRVLTFKLIYYSLVTYLMWDLMKNMGVLP